MYIHYLNSAWQKICISTCASRDSTKLKTIRDQLFLVLRYSAYFVSPGAGANPKGSSIRCGAVHFAVYLDNSYGPFDARPLTVRFTTSAQPTQFLLCYF